MTFGGASNIRGTSFFCRTFRISEARLHNYRESTYCTWCSPLFTCTLQCVPGLPSYPGDIGEFAHRL